MSAHNESKCTTDLADELIAASGTRSTVPPPSMRCPDFSLDDGYQVAAVIADRRRARGWTRSGVKIGLTYRPVWDRIGVTSPFWSMTYEQSTFRGRGDFVLQTGQFVAPRIEVELILGLKHPLKSSADRETVRSAINTVALGFEIVDSHYPRWEGRPADLVAYHGCHAALMVGAALPTDGETLDRLADLRVEISGGEEAFLGRGSNVLGGPLEAALSILPLIGDRTLEPGELISSGSLTGKSHPARPGERWMASTSMTNGPKPIHLDCR